MPMKIDAKEEKLREELRARIKEPNKKLISDNPELKALFERVRAEVKRQGLMGKKSLIIA